MTNLLTKYNIPVPRYTSYPPANFFHEQFTENDLRQAIVTSNECEPQHLSFYIHIPFCRRLCHYCGCNAYPMQRDNEVKAYVDAVLQEIELVCEHIGKNRKIAQIHYGGGSPTAIPAIYIEQINKVLFDKFACIENPEIAIECHPGYMDENDFETLIGAGFNRISIGIQDFNTDVLKAVNRVPSNLPIESIAKLLRAHNIRFNLDFIYGLSLQTEKRFADTICRAIAVSPDRLVTFSYAHVPHLYKRQALLEKTGLPSETVKKNLYKTAQKLLLEAGYRQIGLDHFVKDDDELFHAAQSHTLHRNFQGYCTRRTTGQVYAFGVTAISQLAGAYAQNTKNIAEYITLIGQKKIPVKKGYSLSPDEQITREVITELMCNEQVDWQLLSDRLQLPISTVKSATAYSDTALQAFADDGIIVFDNYKIAMCEKGSPFVRNVAASLDKLLINTDKTFSKPI
ncbi:MAG: oxygen-independent coproporphyrinogen III oxidase [Bacteroidia bacterium]|nr:oxygen-independent coproporphyrinogen III oxidase [Bacteroidia bacterium]